MSKLDFPRPWVSVGRWLALGRSPKRRTSPLFLFRFEDRLNPAGEFADLGSLGLPNVSYSSVAWGDYDNDGDLDVLLTGDSSAGEIARVYRNDSGTFTDIGAGLPGVSRGPVAWGDFDNDGDLDVLITGRDSGNTRFARVYRNDGTAGFTDVNAGLPGVDFGSVVWGDYDNDGDLDVLIAGRDSGYATITRVYRNDGTAGFTDINAGLPGVFFSAVAWGDYDNDGDLDILLTGIDNVDTRFARVYRNDGTAGFTDIGAGLPGVDSGSVAWGDYDNDGDLDILLTGRDSGNNRIARVYLNDGTAGFTVINAGLTGVYRGSAVWGDYDSDGDLDIVLTGRNNGSSRITRVYRNDGTAGFTDINAGLPGVEFGSVVLGDYDTDGDLDILLTGESSLGRIARVIRNDSQTPNTPPAAPTGLSVTVLSATSVRLSWTAATDTRTSTAGLSYNLRVGTTPGGTDITPPMALSTGQRTIVQRGPLQTTTWTLTGLPTGQQFYWSVQAVDTGFAGSTFATEGTFETIAPTVAITRAGTDPTNADAVAFNVTFSEAVNNVDAADFALALGGSVTADATVTVGDAGDADDATYTVTVTNVAGDGTLGLGIAAGTDITDTAGNALDPTPTTTDAYTVDNTAPTVAFTRADPDPTNADAVVFNVTFSEPVQHVDPTDFVPVLGGTVTADATVVVGDAGDTDDATYTVTVTGINGDGTLGLAIVPTTDIEDSVGNDLDLPPATADVYAIDNAAPTIAIGPPSADPTNSGPVTFTITYAGADTITLTADDVVLARTGTADAVVSVSGTGDTRTVTLSGITGDGTLAISIAADTASDAAGNSATAAGPSLAVSVDNAAPTVTVGRAAGQADLTNARPVVFTVTFSEPVSGFDAADVSFAGSTVGGTLAATVTPVGDGRTYTVRVTGMTGDGDVVVGIPTGAASDAAGNGNIASASADNRVRFDEVSPALSILTPPTLVGRVPVTITLRFSTPVFGLDPTRLGVTNATTGPIRAVDASTFALEITPLGTGVVTITALDGLARDEAGNPTRPAAVTVGYVPLVGQNAVDQFAAVPTAPGSTTVTVFGPTGSPVFTATPFTPADAPGGVRVAVADVTGDGTPDLIAGTGPGGALVRVIDGATRANVFSLIPFEVGFTGGMFVAAGDLNGDGFADLVITPDVTGGPRVKIVSGADGSVLADFFGIDDPAFRGGARATLADVNGDGVADLIVSAGTGGGPRIAVWDGTTLGNDNPVRLVDDFFAFEPTLRNGAYVAAGDVDGDGFADLAFGGGPTGGPRVLVLSGADLLKGVTSPLADFFAGNPDARDGVTLVVKEIDGDTKSELIAGTSPAGTGVSVYAGSSLVVGQEPKPLDGFDDILSAAVGVYVG